MMLQNLKEQLFPVGTKRWLIAKVVYKAFKSPKKTLRKINVTNLRKFIYHYQNGDPTSLMAKIELHMPTVENVASLALLPLDDIAELEKNPLVVPMSNSPRVSIIIPVYNQFSYTCKCIKAIAEHSGDISYEVIVADDCSTDKVKKLSEFIKGIRIYRNEKNLRFLLNCNNAAKYARGEYIVFLNNDTQVQPNWLQPLVDLLDQNKDIGLAGSKLIYPDGRLQEAGGIVWEDGSAWNYGNRDNADKPEYNYVKDVDYISGASIMIRKELWEKIGGFDERYSPAYCEDTDLAFSVRKAGYRVVYQPKSVVVHFEGISNGKSLSSGLKKYQAENQQKLKDKWESVLLREHFPLAEEVFHARDRSGGKKTIVVIDHYVPHYDQDAGSKTTWQYIKLLVKMGLKVIFVGDNYFPHQPYTEDLEMLGVEVLAGDGWNIDCFKRWIKNNVAYIDYVYLNRPHIATKYVDFLKKETTAKLLYYDVDLHFLREQREYERTKQTDLLNSIKHWKQIEFDIFNKVDVVYTAGTYEARVLKEVLPPKNIRAIPIFLYDKEVCHKKGPLNNRNTLIFVGGFQHNPNVDAVVWLESELLPKLVSKRPTVKIVVIGSNPPSNIIQLQNENLIFTGFVSDDELKAYYSKARVSLVPLRFGAGVKGKVIESLYEGVPVVTTSIGAEGIPDIETAAAITDNADAFVDEVVRLMDNDAIWYERVHAGWNITADYFSEDSARNFLMDDLGLNSKVN